MAVLGQKRVGHVSTRFSGLDGVSLENAKKVSVLENLGWQNFFFAGQLDETRKACGIEVPEAFFKHPFNAYLERNFWGVETRDRGITDDIYSSARLLKLQLYQFVDKFKIELLVVENSLSLPMPLILGLSLSQFIAETAIPTIAHHHDFYWERNRFRINSVADILKGAYPPDLPSIQHAVIHSTAQAQLPKSILIPNVMDFEAPCVARDDYNAELRQSFGISDNQYLVLQPTRVVPRKGIERAIRLVEYMNHERTAADSEAVLVITHSTGDEGVEYAETLRILAEHAGVKLLFVDKQVEQSRRLSSDGSKIYSYEDTYACADLVTYPSTIEGFGNAFLETVYHRKPIVVNRYDTYVSELEPKGFKVLTMDGMATLELARETLQLLRRPAQIQEMVQHNFSIGSQFFGIPLLERKMRALVENFFGTV